MPDTPRWKDSAQILATSISVVGVVVAVSISRFTGGLDLLQSFEVGPEILRVSDPVSEVTVEAVVSEVINTLKAESAGSELPLQVQVDALTERTLGLRQAINPDNPEEILTIARLGDQIGKLQDQLGELDRKIEKLAIYFTQVTPRCCGPVGGLPRLFRGQAADQPQRPKRRRHCCSGALQAVFGCNAVAWSPKTTARRWAPRVCRKPGPQQVGAT